MFDEDKYMESDDLMRSILSQAQEEVPEHIWEGISSELDRIEAAGTRKTVFLWFRRTAIAAAAAAAVAVGVFTDWNGNGDLVAPSEKNLISVTGTPQINTGKEFTRPASIADRKVSATDIQQVSYLADAGDKVKEAAPSAETVESAESVESENKTDGLKPSVNSYDIWSDIWEEETPEKTAKKRETSIVMSGLAGTNGVKSSGLSPLRRPSIPTSKPKTGVEQKSSESTYGLPVSVGAGVKIGLGNRWSLGVGANYTILTRKFFGTYTLVNSTGGIDESISSDIRNIQQYVGIPVNAYYNIIDKDFLNFYAYAGGTFERCISDKYEVLNTSYIYKGKAQGLQLSANAGIGVEFLLGKHLGLYIDPSLRYYFNCKQPKSIRTAQPLMLGFEMGLRVNL